MKSLGVKIIQQAVFEPITEKQLTDLILEKLTETHPNIKITNIDFKHTKKDGVSVQLDGHLIENAAVETDTTPAQTESLAKKSEPIELPEADDVEEEEAETELSRDGVPTKHEQTEGDLIDEVLAEEYETRFDTAEDSEPEPEEKPKKKAKSLAEMFQSQGL